MGRVLSPRDDAFLAFARMPELSGKAKDAYIATYGQDVYDKWCDDGDKYHGGQSLGEEALKQPRPAFTHRPDHDCESLFWTLLHSLVKALPLNGPHGLHFSVRHYTLKNVLFGHSIERRAKVDDYRGIILRWLESDLESTLHPGLQERGLGLLLKQMAEQVQPEYAWLEPKPRVDHLHEAFRRLLLQFIIDFESDTRGDIELHPMQERIP